MNVVKKSNENRTNECMEVEWKPPNRGKSEKEKRRSKGGGEREKEVLKCGKVVQVNDPPN